MAENSFIETWADTIKKVEGWSPGSRSYRNNNPGNLIPPGGKTNYWAGQTGVDEKGFARFDSEASGRAALEKDLSYKADKYSDWSILNIMTRYLGGDPKSNPEGNPVYAKGVLQGDPRAYAKRVADALNVDVSAKLGDLKKGSAPPKGTGPQGGSTPGKAADGKMYEAEPLESVPLIGTPVDPSILSKLDPDLIIDHDLGNTPWYDDTDLVVGNPHLNRIGFTPASFVIALNDKTGSMLPTKKGGNEPIRIVLNTSLSKLSVTMKHVMNKSLTRTGMHFTFWGQEPDQIQGSGSTGVFMNYFGVTDLMSLPGSMEKYNLLDLLTEEQQDKRGFATSQNKLRVAAQDAFVEMLSMFRNNGIIRYRKENYDGLFDNREQIQPSVWSPTYGDSTYGSASRNNDVMVKGSVIFNYKNNNYYGYFKNLLWSLDADSPFQWKFEFTFQVERTMSFALYPK